MLFTEDNLDVVSAKGQRFFGAPIGIMMLDCVAPWIPGSVGNASTFSAPVSYRTVEGLTVDEIFSPEAGQHTERVVEAARALVAEGAQIVTANCGFAARYQRSVQAAVGVPVLLSSMLLVPFLQTMLPSHQKLGVITASSKSLTSEFLDSIGISYDPDRLVIAGLDGYPAFEDAFITCSGTADIPAIRNEVVTASRELVANNQNIGGLLMECSELPPYAAAVQEATGLPVYDFTSLIEFFAGSLRRTPFTGYY